MAETFYGYQERDPESQINWAEVGKNFSDMLAEEARVREEKKSAIDEATREAQRKINETPQGQNETLSDFALDFAADAQEVMLIQERLLKSGRLKPRDYTVMRQNLVDGTDQAFSVLQTYQDEFARKMEMRNNGETQYLDQWQMENAESFGNFNRSKLVINPETGQVSVAFMDENGKIPTDPTKFRAVSSLRNSIGMDFMKYDLDKNTADFVKSQGNWQQITRSIGSASAKGIIQIMSDPMKKTITEQELIDLGITDPLIQQGVLNYYNEAENIFINSQLNDDYNTSSILTDFGQAGYTFTYDPKQQGDKTILLTTDSQGRPVPQYTDEQRKDAESILRSAIRSKISKSVETTVVSDYIQPSASQVSRGEAVREQANVMTSVANLYSGNAAQQKEAGNFLKSINPDILKIDRDLTGVTIFYEDGSEQKMPFSEQSESQWATGSTNYFLPSGSTILDINETSRAAGLTGATTPMAGKLSITTDIPEKESIDEVFERVVLSDIKPNIFITGNEPTTLASIRSILYSVESLRDYKIKGSTFSNEIDIFDKNNNLVERFNIDKGKNDPTDYADRLRKLIESRATQDDKMSLASKRRIKKKEEPKEEATTTEGKEEATTAEGKKKTPASEKQ
jgi:hypothetical protein